MKITMMNTTEIKNKMNGATVHKINDINNGEIWVLRSNKILKLQKMKTSRKNKILKISDAAIVLSLRNIENLGYTTSSIEWFKCFVELKEIDTEVMDGMAVVTVEYSVLVIRQGKRGEDLYDITVMIPVKL